jgi:hypothetical protein
LILFSSHQGREADTLVSAGFVEGSNRVHPGQGTRNRKFYFENFFLEIVWIHDEEELKSEQMAPTCLWERANHSIYGLSPFALCLAPTEDSVVLFRNSIRYQPSYGPEGNAFSILTHKKHPYLPWTCRLPRMSRWTGIEEPMRHSPGMRKLSKVIFGIPVPDFHNSFTNLLQNSSIVFFEAAAQYKVTLEFDHQEKGQRVEFKEIPLVFTF